MGRGGLKVAGLFAGIGGFELGFSRAGLENVLLCEIDEAARAVLQPRFQGIDIREDVADVASLPDDVDLVSAGFPCQNLSMAGDKSGISGAKSTIVDELFRLLETRPVRWVVIENVYFMLHLNKGAGIAYTLERLEMLGYSWAYRVVDSRSFGLAQRRRRVFILASRDDDPRTVLLVDDAGKLVWPKPDLSRPIGFYWTEGRSGHGLTGDAIPPLKAGSGVDIPSPPAVLLPSGRVVTPSIEAVERLQGFPARWTSVLRARKRKRYRWRLVGNAVSVPVAKWIGDRILAPGTYDQSNDNPIEGGQSWPIAAYNIGDGRKKSVVSENPVRNRRGRLSAFDTSGWPDLSHRALRGFVTRARAITTNLKYPNGFLEALEARLKSS